MPEFNVANIVRLTRVKGLPPIDCQIFDSTTGLIVASEVSASLDLDGLCLIPTNTVRSFDRDFDRVRFYNAAVEGPGLAKEVNRLRDMLSSSWADDLSLFERLRLPIAVHLEFDDPDVCYVGTVCAISRDAFCLRRVSSYGDRIEEPMEIILSVVTKIEVRTRYLDAIARVLT